MNLVRCVRACAWKPSSTPPFVPSFVIQSSAVRFADLCLVPISDHITGWRSFSETSLLCKSPTWAHFTFVIRIVRYVRSSLSGLPLYKYRIFLFQVPERLICRAQTDNPDDEINHILPLHQGILLQSDTQDGAQAAPAPPPAMQETPQKRKERLIQHLAQLRSRASRWVSREEIYYRVKSFYSDFQGEILDSNRVVVRRAGIDLCDSGRVEKRKFSYSEEKRREQTRMGVMVARDRPRANRKQMWMTSRKIGSLWIEFVIGPRSEFFSRRGLIIEELHSE